MPVNNTDTILVKLKSLTPYGLCDDCLSTGLRITPRQQVNAICRRLHGDGVVGRMTAACDACNKVKLTNTVAAPNDRQRDGK